MHDFGLIKASDADIWEFARSEGYALVSKDEDFHVRRVLDGPLPKVLWIRSGNCSTDLVETLLRKNAIEVEKFERNSDAGFLALM